MMRDVSEKEKTHRYASAEAILKVKEETIRAIKEGKAPKGDPVEIAKIAGIMSAKRTSELIPYCHPVPIDWANVEIELRKDEIYIKSEVKAQWKTGVEMEALFSVTISALTIYDMLKPIDKTMEITSIKLIEKKGGKSDFGLSKK
ncbi:MAG: cyclic pyranopterin monophosphate synthase MoaC [Candidatus Aminicenantia bacterium]